MVWNVGLHESQAGINIVQTNINKLSYADDITLMVRDKEAGYAAVHGISKSRIWLNNWTTTTVKNAGVGASCMLQAKAWSHCMWYVHKTEYSEQNWILTDSPGIVVNVRKKSQNDTLHYSTHITF